MAVSIADMERVAMGGSRFGGDNDIGNVIELGDLNDDLGMSLLANPNKVSVSTSSQSTDRVVNFASAPPASSSFAGPSSSFSGIDVTPLEPMEPISISSEPFDFGATSVEINYAKDAPNTSSFGGLFGNSQSATGPGVQLSSASKDPQAEKKEKSEYLNKLQRLEQKGFPVARKYTMDNGIDEIKTEYFRLVDARQLETSLKFQRQMLMGAITGMEWLNGKFDPFDIKLEGWSESVHENVEDFDEIFEELYDKYKDRGKMSPEMRLIMAVGGSGFMCHVSNSFFRSKMPSMDDVLRNNPELARQMAAAAAQQAGPGFGNFMGMAMGVPNPSQAQAPPVYPGNGGPMFAGPAPMGPAPSQPMPTADTGAFFAASAATPSSMPQPRPVARREMTGPTGVDDILRQFEEVRRAEVTASSFMQPATGYSTQPAVAAAVGSASVISAEDMRSQADSAQTGGGRRGRRRAQPPVGNTISLNV